MDHHSTTTTTMENTTNTMPLEALDYPYQVSLIILYSLTACLAFISNLLTIIVMMNGKRCIGDMRKFIVNLSIADILMAIFTIPFTYTNYMLGRWIFISFMCPIVNCAQLTTIAVSIYTLIAIAIDRYVAIMHPLRQSISWFKRHRTFIVILIWISGVCLGITQLIVTETYTFIYNGQQYIYCGERWKPESIEGRLYTIFIFSTTFAIPMSTLCIIYTAMGWKIFRYQGPEYNQRLYYHHHHHHIQKKTSIFDDDDDDEESSNQCSHMNYHFVNNNMIINNNISDGGMILKILITIISVFTICWLPIQLFNILIYFKRNFLHVDSSFKYYAFVGSYFFCHWISMAHSFMNPIIYSFMSKNFRIHFIKYNGRYYAIYRTKLRTMNFVLKVQRALKRKKFYYYQSLVIVLIGQKSRNH
ncbi:hypothetical protein DERP_006807 [Dermatophagoides pteronyssinus]|uniref:G-protein coupled receptors family 1 profile domain-containing protein n=1 Tax=Dermatophagoides pteronyssinus TaxID=6956 RepID=A0ABQ8IS20_DERPT|nr:hypothetical protein DERP_006807 [Dermatophagoides pteronyssinus]